MDWSWVTHSWDNFPKYSSVEYSVHVYPDFKDEYQSIGSCPGKPAISDPNMTKGMILYHPRYDTAWIIVGALALVYLFILFLNTQKLMLRINWFH